MTIVRLLVLQAVLAAGLGTTLFIPRETKIQPCRVRMELPEWLGSFQGMPASVTDQEHALLAGDTEFCRKVYDDGFGDQALVSIVLSGHDLDNSIHRPERCLPTQGWAIQGSKRLNLPVPEAPGGLLPVTELVCRAQQKRGGKVVDIHNLNFYWFIGYSDITASHFTREYLDMKDRLLHGYNQRWAYVTVAATVTEGLEMYGKNEQQTEAMLEKMITEVYPQIVAPKGQGTTLEDTTTAAR